MKSDCEVQRQLLNFALHEVVKCAGSGVQNASLDINMTILGPSLEWILM